MGSLYLHGSWGLCDRLCPIRTASLGFLSREGGIIHRRVEAIERLWCQCSFRRCFWFVAVHGDSGDEVILSRDEGEQW
jgi:hypothetical protein